MFVFCAVQHINVLASVVCSGCVAKPIYTSLKQQWKMASSSGWGSCPRSPESNTGVWHFFMHLAMCRLCLCVCALVYVQLYVCAVVHEMLFNRSWLTNWYIRTYEWKNIYQFTNWSPYILSTYTTSHPIQRCSPKMWKGRGKQRKESCVVLINLSKYHLVTP